MVWDIKIKINQNVYKQNWNLEFWIYKLEDCRKYKGGWKNGKLHGKDKYSKQSEKKEEWRDNNMEQKRSAAESK